MSKQPHRPRRRPARPRRPVPYCKAHWTPQQRLAYYSKPDPLTGCLVWQGSEAAGGYGYVTCEGRNWLAHRLAWTLKNGPIPKDLILCHRCDERRCINPDHLFLGTRRDNMHDLKAKREHRSDARADASGLIRIIYRGVELVGRVRVAAVDPRVKKVEDKARRGPS
jgi:HNH endonuclease